MKRNFKSVLAVCLVISFLLPAVIFKNNIKSNSGLHSTTAFFTVDPEPER